MNHASIEGSWTHSFEEDQRDIQVYRPTHSFAFPPSRRGRETLQFGEGGALTMEAPGPDDRPRSTGGCWVALGMNRFKLSGITSGSDQIIEVVQHTSEILRIRRD